MDSQDEPKLLSAKQVANDIFGKGLQWLNKHYRHNDRSRFKEMVPNQGSEKRPAYRLRDAQRFFDSNNKLK